MGILDFGLGAENSCGYEWGDGGRGVGWVG